MSELDKIVETVTIIRRDLHQNPATSYEEFYASDKIAETLTTWGIPFERGWAETGIVATIKGKRESNRSIGLRADIDALDIIETSGQPWSSKIHGKMHACGHDGHTASLLGTARYLSLHNDFAGTVYLFFQPAEEGGGGAIRMINEGLFDKYPVEQVYAYHNWPYLKRGQIATRVGPILGAIDRVRITLTGRGGHAAIPHSTIDPIPAAAYLTTALQTIVARNIDPLQSAVVSVTNLNAGTGAENIIPKDVRMTISVRSLDETVRDQLKERITSLVKSTAEGFNLSYDIDYERGYDATANEAECTAMTSDVARQIVGNSNVDDNFPPSLGAEDFGAMLKKKPGCYVLIGQGEDDAESPHNKGLHHDAYDFNDKIIPIAIQLFDGIVKRVLG